MVCAPPAVGGMGSAGLLALTLLLHELQLIFIDFLLSITGIRDSLGIVAAKHCLGIDYCEAQARVRQGMARDGPQGKRP